MFQHKIEIEQSEIDYFTNDTEYELEKVLFEQMGKKKLSLITYPFNEKKEAEFRVTSYIDPELTTNFHTTNMRGAINYYNRLKY